ncbi:MAG: vitamin K epoxide reductase family protein [Microgenomates group bacterium]|nr:vitamin K epoxide reductase family protein [Candidatus Woesebacteria bacterium]
MKKESIFKYVKWLAMFGVLLAVYLLWQQIAQPAFKPCSINASINCDAVITGPVSKTFGISTPLFGLVGYVVILIASILKKPKLMLSMATFGLVFCLWIAYQELVLLRVICPVCILCQIVMLSVFTLSIKVQKKAD